MPGWDAESRTWWGWEFLGPEPVSWMGPMQGMAAEEGLHAYHIRNIPIPVVGGVPILCGPRPPYFSWYGHPAKSEQPHYFIDEYKVAGNGVYLAQD